MQGRATTCRQLYATMLTGPRHPRQHKVADLRRLSALPVESRRGRSVDHLLYVMGVGFRVSVSPELNENVTGAGTGSLAEVWR